MELYQKRGNQGEKPEKETGVEIAGSLTPELSHPGGSHPHPFRYMGTQQEGTAPRGLHQSEKEGQR